MLYVWPSHGCLELVSLWSMGMITCIRTICPTTYVFMQLFVHQNLGLIQSLEKCTELPEN